jgi:hypothetical protein
MKRRPRQNMAVASFKDHGRTFDGVDAQNRNISCSGRIRLMVALPSGYIGPRSLTLARSAEQRIG